MRHIATSTDRLDADKQRYDQDTAAKTLGDVIADADVFLGLSSAGVLKPETVAKMGASRSSSPNVDAASITYNALRVTAGGGVTVGGILLGAAQPVHVMTPSSTVRRIVNMTAVAVADARSQDA